MERFRARKDARPAFTLVEILLVLAIVAIVASVAMATLQGPMARQRLKAASDNVRTEWCTARTDAMKSGHTYAFRYIVHGSRFHLGPQDDSPAANAAPAAPPAAQHACGEEDASDDEPLPPPLDGALPQGIHFLPESEVGDEPEIESADSGGDWSDPIYFYADGSTSDAGIALASGKNATMRLHLRGITGSVTVGDGATM
jgi:prepilin-type N-terminal cleavage/methylation domain-containing protein